MDTSWMPPRDCQRPPAAVRNNTDDEGRVTRVVQWFDYKLHLVVDVTHAVALGYAVSDNKAGDGETLPLVLAQAQANPPEKRVKTLAFGKAADSEQVHKLLHHQKIKPLIQNRSL